MRRAPASPVPSRAPGAASRSRQPVPARAAGAPRKAFVVAIAGGSGSGKSWLARKLEQRLQPHARVLALDHFYRDLSHLSVPRRERCNFDTPRAIDWTRFREAIAALAAGRATELPQYDFVTHTRRKERVPWPATRVVLVEGLWPWWPRDLRSCYGLRLFRDGGAGLRLERRIDRDTRERGRTAVSVRRQWREQVQPMHLRYVIGQARTASVVLSPDLDSPAVDQLAEQIRTLAGLDMP